MTIQILFGISFAAGVVILIASYFVVERQKDLPEDRKRQWYKSVLIPWMVFIVSGFFGAFLMHRDYESNLANAVVIPRWVAAEYLKPEKMYLVEDDQ